MSKRKYPDESIVVRFKGEDYEAAPDLFGMVVNDEVQSGYVVLQMYISGGWQRGFVSVHDVTPLTPAARDLLELVTS